MKASATNLGVVAFCVVIGAISCSNGVALGPPSASDLASSPAAPSAVPTPTPTTTTTTAPPTTTTTPPTPAPAPTPAQKIAYSPDLQPFFTTDCTSCHGGSRPSGHYSMTSYGDVMKAVKVGSASSALVIVTRSNGSMYRFFSGDRATKSAMVNQWVVTDGTAQSR